MGLPAGLSSCPQGQDDSGVAAEARSGIYLCQGFGPRGIQTSTPWTINCGLFWGTWLAENVTIMWKV